VLVKAGRDPPALQAIRDEHARACAQGLGVLGARWRRRLDVGRTPARERQGDGRLEDAGELDRRVGELAHGVQRKVADAVRAGCASVGEDKAQEVRRGDAQVDLGHDLVDEGFGELSRRVGLLLDDVADAVLGMHAGEVDLLHVRHEAELAQDGGHVLLGGRAVCERKRSERQL